MEIKLYEINELMSRYGNKRLTELIPIIQTGREYDCAQCRGTSQIATGDPENPLEECPLCEGIGKTEQEYQEVCTEKDYRLVEPTPEVP